MQKTVNLWLDSPNVTATEKKEIQALEKAELEDAFYMDLAFGTAGMRGLMGPGTNRINTHTIARASAGYAMYINNSDIKQRVAIAYDNRNNSKLYAEVAASVLAKHDIEVLVFKELMPTPLLSYAVRELDCGGGIVITASHNPKEYNGFKVYDENGCQLIPELIEQVIENVESLSDYLAIDTNLNAKQKLLIKTIDDSLVEKYLTTVLTHQNYTNDNDDFSVVFSPQHGTGVKIIPEILKRANYKCHSVASQSVVDGDFSNTLSPNPEDPSAYIESIVLAKEKGANIVVTSDPDADRVGVAVRHEDEYVLLNGNETTVLILYYLLNQAKKANKLTKDSLVINTVVTSDLGEVIAKDFGAKTLKTLTGFKYIGTLIDEGSNLENYVYGYEESYGSLPIPIIRDKDAVSATLLLSEMAAKYDKKAMTLIDVLNEVYEKYGYYYDTQTNEVLEGADGVAKIKEIMKKFYEVEIGLDDGLEIVRTENYDTSVANSKTGKETIDLESAAVMKIFFKDLGWIAIRPSGTEPKIKFYYSTKGSEMAVAKDNFKKLSIYVANKLV